MNKSMIDDAKKLQKNLDKIRKENNITTYTKSDKQLLDFIQQFFCFYSNNKPPKDWHYKCQYDFILQHGKFYQSQELTEQEREVVTEAIKNMGFKPRMKECFYNAQILAISDKSGLIKYCEGFAMSIIPVNHGWCTINDKVIDITWKDGNANNYFGEFNNSYFGFNISTDRISNKMVKTNWAVSWLDDWNDGWELFKKPFNNK